MPPPRRVVLVVNPRSAKGLGAKRGRLAAAALTRAGIDVAEVIGANALDASTRAREAMGEPDVDGLVVVGGDGTVSLGLELVAQTDVPLGVIPAGTGNDFARTLGIPLDPSAAQAVVDGETRSVDLGRAGDRLFATVLACGFDSAVNDRANRMRWPHGRLRYDIAMLQELKRMSVPEFEITLDGETITTDAVLVAVGNGPSYGGGMRICPQADIDDGTFQVTLVERVSRTTLLRIFPGVYSGRHIRHPAVSVHQASKVRLAASGVTAWADGEYVDALPVVCETVRDAVTVFAPRRQGASAG